MAKCDEGYLCEVCGRPVEGLAESDLYLRYVLREVQIEQLHVTPERHIRCNPVQAQFIVDSAFEPVAVEGMFDKRLLDPDEVRRMERRTSAAWQRLREVTGSELPVAEYPLDLQTLRALDEAPSD